MSSWSRHLSHDAGPVVQFVKYAIAGGCATAVHIVIFYLAAWKIFPCLGANDALVKLLGLSVPVLTDAVRGNRSLLANGLAFLCSNLVAYLLNRLFVFKPGRHHWVVESLLFFAVSGLSVAIGSAIMRQLIVTLGWQTTLAFGANLITSLLINYALRRFVIFKG